VNEGKFKTPILYGNGSEHVAKYRDVEHAIKTDLDKWLCNMYFEIQPLRIANVLVDRKAKMILYKKPLDQ
jgi:hypothetical protein